MISDVDNMVGGELQVLTRDRDQNALEILNSQTDSYMPHEIMTVNYNSAGNGIFMQGSHIFHQVTSVIEAPRPRISLVNSFMVNDVFVEDWTKFSTYRDVDPPHVTYLEYARLVSHRSKGMLDFIIEHVEFDSPNADNKEKNRNLLLKVIKTAIEELQHGYSLLNHEKDDVIGYFDASAKEITRVEKC